MVTVAYVGVVGLAGCIVTCGEQDWGSVRHVLPRALIHFVDLIITSVGGKLGSLLEFDRLSARNILQYRHELAYRNQRLAGEEPEGLSRLPALSN